MSFSITSPSHDLLANSLKGKTITLPNLNPLFEEWPQSPVNPNYEKLKPLADAKIISLGLTGKKLAKFIRSDIALFVSCWWPRADFEACVTILYLIVWLFVWDDEVDIEASVPSANFAAAEEFRDQTFRFIEHSLGFGKDSVPPIAPNPIINSFEGIGERLRYQYNYEQRQRCLEELRFYLHMTQVEQELKANDRIPTLKEYWHMRFGSSAVAVCLTMAELAVGSPMPSHLMQSPNMKSLWDNATIGICINNDILSLKKELKSNCILSILPLSVASGLSLQESLEDVLGVLRDSINEVNAAGNMIMLDVREDSEDHEVLKRYIDTIKFNQSGNHYWSQRTERYLPAGSVQEDDTIVITL